MTSYYISELSLKNIDEVYEIAKEEFGKHCWLYNQFKEELCFDNRMNFILKTDGKVVSYALASYNSDEINILYIATKNEYKRKGYASILLEHIENNARTKNIGTIYLEVKETNFSAISFYENNDFIQISKRPNYYSDQTTAIVLQKKINII